MNSNPTSNGGQAPACYSYSFPVEHLDPEAVSIIERLERSGHVAYMVGGCVRDLLLGIRPKDYDLATSASPRQTKRLFHNSRIIGRRFRLVHVFYPDKIIELSTFRRDASSTTEPDVMDGDETDDRDDDLLIRSDNVFGTPREDAVRRDFTINALFYSPIRQQIIDYVGGIDDLKARRLTTIGEPSIRFREDPVRIIRALKLAVRLHLTIEPATMDAIREHGGELVKSAPPRILEELFKILGSGAAAGTFRAFFDTGVLASVVPPLDARLRSSSPPTPDDLWRILEALDEVDGGHRTHTNAVLLGAMLLPLFDTPFTTPDEGPSSLEPPTDGGVNDLIHACPALGSIARRDKDLLRQILLVQRRLFRGGRGRRGLAPAAIARRPYFEPALQLFAVAATATGRGLDDLEWWRQRLAGHPVEDEAPEGEAVDESFEAADLEELKEIDAIDGDGDGPPRDGSRRRRRRRPRRYHGE